MRRFTTYAALGSLVLAVVYGPMFHLHTGDDHDGGGSFIHAHFPELPHLETEPGPEVEPNHGHASARSIDFLTTKAPSLVHVEFTVVEEPLRHTASESLQGFSIIDEPRAHAPPLVASSIPRSPPV